MNSSIHRRHFLTTAGSALAGTQLFAAVGTVPGALNAQEPVAASRDDYVLQSQPLPIPTVKFPTDDLPAADVKSPPKRIAAITTAYFKYSHADDIITKFIEGYAIVGRIHQPHCRVVGMYIEQFPDTDIGRGMAARYRIPLFDTPAGALTQGRNELAVDGVLLIGEHGEYPENEKGQRLYPRHRLFSEIVSVFRRTGRSVPVYCDKHFSYSWDQAAWMYEQSRQLGFPMMAGSSVPVTWRRPALAFRQGVTLDGALAVGFNGLEVYGFHTLEVLQTFIERRGRAACGVKSVQCLEGDAAWNAAGRGEWEPRLLQAALRVVPAHRDTRYSLDDLRRVDAQAAVFLVEYADGFKSAAYISRRLLSEFAFAASVRGRSEPVATWLELPKPQRDHFSFLSNHIEVMFRTGKASYPVERTYLVTGILAAAMDSRFEKGKRIETPHLAEIQYTPAPEYTV